MHFAFVQIKGKGPRKQRLAPFFIRGLLLKYISIVRSGDFTRAYKKGKAWVNPLVVVYINKNWVGHTRVGITTSKKIGGAVQRNRAKRVIKSALYKTLPQNSGSYDIVFVARKTTTCIKSPKLEAVFAGIFKKAGLL